MKLIKYIISFLPAAVFSQIGIGTTAPSASLDIVSNGANNATRALSVKDKNEATLFDVSDNGNFYFKGSLSLNGDSGVLERVLVSDGDNNPPRWVNENSSIVKKFVLVGYNGFNNTTSAYSATNSSMRLNPSTINLNSSQIGSWNSTLSEYTVAKAGVFEVTVDAKISVQVNNANRNGYAFLYLGNFFLGSQGKNETGSLRNIHLYAKASRYLNVGEKIYINASSNTNSWRIDQSNININFSERTL